MGLKIPEYSDIEIILNGFPHIKFTCLRVLDKPDTVLLADRRDRDIIGICTLFIQVHLLLTGFHIEYSIAVTQKRPFGLNIITQTGIIMKEKTTNELQAILSRTKPDQFNTYLEENRDSMYFSDRPFSEFMREQFRAKKLTQQDIFTQAGIPERYGYKLISGEKKTVQRDIILRICIVAGFSLKDTQTALTLYGMPVLYSKIPRDSVFIIALNQKLKNIERVDELMEKYGFAAMTTCGTEDS